MSSHVSALKYVASLMELEITKITICGYYSDMFNEVSITKADWWIMLEPGVMHRECGQRISQTPGKCT